VLVEALSLWRGAPLGEFADHDFAAGPIARLDELRLVALEDRLAADLELGRHAAVIGELTQLVADQPLRERTRAHLALALYRSGRQGDALRTLDDARRTLVEELGIDPGRPLRELEAAILAHDPSLDLALSPAALASLPPAVDPPAAPLVGREPELAELREALAEAGTSTRVAIIEGDPGIGKTRLAEELVAEAARRGATVLWGRAFEGGAAPAFWPWLPPLRALVAAGGDDGPSPELAHLLAPSTTDTGDARSAEPARFALFEAVAALLARRARARPIVLVLDDLQWADVASLELLVAVLGRLDEVPLLLVCTVRELEVGRNDAVVDALAAITRRLGTRRLGLRGLTRAATEALVRQTTGELPPGTTMDAIYARVEGNPFFTTEVARLLAAGEGLADVPSGVRDVVRRRLTALPPDTAELLEVGAVIGRDVDLSLLAAASGHDLDVCLDHLEPAIVQRLLIPVPEQPGTVRFAHALVREVVADDVTTLRRARLNLRVADALHDDDDTAEILAEHLWKAAPIGVGQRAAAALERAAHVAVLRLAYAAADDLLERAVQLRRTAGTGSDHAAAELSALAQLVAVKGARLGYASLNGSPLLSRGKQLAEQLGRNAELLHLLWVEWAGLDLACLYERAEPTAAELLARSTVFDDPVGPVLGHTAFGITRWHRGDIRGAAEHLDAANDLATGILTSTSPLALLDRDGIRLSAPFGVYLHELIGDRDDADAGYQAAINLLPHDPFWELVVVNFTASAALSTGQADRVVRAAHRGMAADPEGVSAFWSMALRCYCGAALCLLGKVDEGLAMLDPAWATYKAMGLRTNAPTWLGSRAHGLALAGRVEEAEASLAEAQHVLHAYRDDYAISTVLLAEAVVRHARGDAADEVVACLREAVDVATAQGSTAMAERVRRDAAGLGIDLSA
jgi:tetratricopeptide (TPR) repeat protein